MIVSWKSRLVSHCRLKAFFCGVGVVLVAGLSHAQQTTVPEAAPQEQAELSEDESQAMAVVTERSVKGTVAFLASDELEGRGTPSAGFDVACGYVASRFEAAGLVGGGDDGSWYHTHELSFQQLPTDGIDVRAEDGAAVAHFGLIAASETPVTVSAPITELGDWDRFRALPEDKRGGLTGIVLVRTDPDEDDDRELRTWRRRLRLLADDGAQALLLAVAADSPLIEQARRMQIPFPADQAATTALPILLVEADFQPVGNVDLTIPAAINSQRTIRNVVGVLPGSDPELAKQAVVFSAHLDHLGIRGEGEGDHIYNGADDNASGVTGVISLADAYGALAEPPRRTMLFVAFWGEEKGLLGSKHMVEDPVWPLDQTVCMINLEMIGRPEDGAREKSWMTGWTESNLGELMNEGSQRVGVEIFEHPQFSRMLYGASDNAPFVSAGVIAHSFSAGSLHGDYHQPGDHWQKLETDHMTRVIQGLFAGSLRIAKGDVTPESR